MPKLSPRLQLIANQLLPNKPVWDFCCDHGYVGIYAGLTGLFPEVHFVDQVEPLIQKLRTDFSNHQYPCSERTKFYFWAQAGQNVPAVVTGNAVIAGVGGYPIMEILKGLKNQNLLRADRLVLSPHTSEEQMTGAILADRFLEDYRLLAQYCVQERNRIRTIWIFDHQ